MHLQHLAVDAKAPAVVAVVELPVAVADVLLQHQAVDAQAPWVAAADVQHQLLAVVADAETHVAAVADAR